MTDNNKENIENFVTNFFEISKSTKSPSHESPLVKIGEVLQRKGISISHLREAICVLISIISPQLGDPVPVVITEDEGAGAIQFLDTCLELAPEGSWIEFRDKGKKDVPLNQDLKTRSLVSYDADLVKKELLEILLMTERGSKTPQWKERTDPVSFVVFSRNPDNPILQNPYVTKIHLTADQNSKVQRFKSMSKHTDLISQSQLEVESACVRTMLKRLKGCPVDINFADKIMGDSAINAQNIVPLYDLTLRMIRNITRINNPPTFIPLEAWSAFIGVDFDKIRQQDQVDYKLDSTKVDYHYYKLIFGDLLNLSDDYITPRQTRIYNAVKAHNIEKLARYNRRLSEEVDILGELTNPIVKAAWGSRDDIWNKVNSDGGEELSRSTVNKELETLTKLDIILSGKHAVKKIKYGYAINQLRGDLSLTVSDPGDIKDLVLKGKTVNVTNPLTGAIDTI